MATSLEILRKCFSDAHIRQIQREGEILSLFEATQPAIKLLAKDRELVKDTINKDGSKIKLVSIGKIIDFPAEPKYPSIRLPERRTLTNSMVADATTLVFTDMSAAGLIAEGMLGKLIDHKVLFVCYHGGPIQQEQERIDATVKLFQLINILTPSLEDLYAIVGRPRPNKKEETEYLLRQSILRMPERLQKISHPCYISSIHKKTTIYGTKKATVNFREAKI
jgi:hypothetical protein